MNDKHPSFKELSAYLDGESRHPDTVRDHLQRCADCARRHAELGKLSSHLQAMPPPDVSPAFATRVMAAVREETPAASPAFYRCLPAFAAAGVALAVLLAVALLATRDPSAPARVAAGNSPAALPSDAETDRMMAAIAGRVARGEGIGTLEDELPAWNDAPPAAEEELAALADTEWFGALANELDTDTDEDVDTMLSSLDPEEARVFMQLLAEYAKEG
jgi:anti-sigma factor RsiW